MKTQTEALKQALEALEQLDGLDTETECVTIDVGDVIDAIKKALAQPEQCQCPNCRVTLHASDCAVHNEPAYPKDECNCGAQQYNATSDHRLMENAQGDLEGIKLVQTAVGIGKPEQEPVAWHVYFGNEDEPNYVCIGKKPVEANTVIRPLVFGDTTPPQPKEPEQEQEPVADNAYGYAKSLAEAIFKQHFSSDDHYASGRIVWGVNDTVIGILTQIDNMVAGMVRRPAQPEQEPVAWESLLGAVARGWCYEENANKTMDSDLAVAIAKEVQALYTTPPQPEQNLNCKSTQARLATAWGYVKAQPKEPEQEEYLSKAYRLANELRCHLAIAPAPQRTWVGLTEEEFRYVYQNYMGNPADTWDYERAIEAKLKEKNNV